MTFRKALVFLVLVLIVLVFFALGGRHTALDGDRRRKAKFTSSGANREFEVTSEGRGNRHNRFRPGGPASGAGTVCGTQRIWRNESVKKNRPVDKLKLLPPPLAGRCCVTRDEKRTPAGAAWLLALVLILASGVTVRAQVIANPNQIAGDIELTNLNPDITTVLQGPFAPISLQILANSVGTPSPLGSQMVISDPNPLTTPYEISVEAGPAGAGIEYDVTVDAELGDSSRLYRFATMRSDSVDEEPAPNVILNIQECIGFLDINWVSSIDGLPVPIRGGSITASRESNPGSADFDVFQSGDSDVDDGVMQQFLAVRGDGVNFEVETFYQYNLIPSDPTSTIVAASDLRLLSVGCDEVVRVEIVVQLPSGPGDGFFSRIEGNIDMLGETEHALNDRTLVLATNGPNGNSGSDTVPGTLFGMPSSGAFAIENLFPSGSVTPAEGYRVVGEMFFRTGNQFTLFQTRPLSQPKVIAPAGETVDLGNTFVMTPGYQTGQILLAGLSPG